MVLRIQTRAIDRGQEEKCERKYKEDIWGGGKRYWERESGTNGGGHCFGIGHLLFVCLFN